MGNGLKANFRWDIWALDVLLYALSIVQIPEDLVNSPVAEFVSSSGMWN